jgi:MFS family permease
LRLETQVWRPWAVVLERNFGSLWFGQVISGFGDKITVIALADLTWRLTHSSFYTALAVIVATVPHAFFGFFAGPIADAVGPRRTMVLCDLARAVLVAAIPVAVLLRLPLATVYILVLAATFCAAVFNPARLALVPQLVPARQLASANSMVLVSDRTVEIVGYAAAGILVAAIGSAAFYIDAATFVISAFMLQRIFLTSEARRSQLSFASVIGEAGTGLRVIHANAVLWINLLFSLVAQVSIAVLATLAPVLFYRDFCGGVEACGAASFGASEAAIAAGVVLSGLAVPSFMGRVRKGTLVIAGFALLGTALILLGLAPNSAVAIAVFGLAGMANAIFLIPNITIYQEHTPPELRSRVFGTRLALLHLSWLPVMVLVGSLGDAVPAAVLIGLAGLVTLVTAIVGLFIPSVRDVA